MEGERMYRVAEVAERLDVHPQTIREWLREGVLDGIRLGGTKAGWRIPAGSVDAFIERRRASPSGAVISAQPPSGPGWEGIEVNV
jgi:excisionase family DNA binding protein